MSSVTPEAAVASSFYAARPKTPQTGSSASTEFANLVDSNVDADSSHATPPRDASTPRGDDGRSTDRAQAADANTDRPANSNTPQPATGVHKQADGTKKADSSDKRSAIKDDGDETVQDDADQVAAVVTDGTAGIIVPVAVAVPAASGVSADAPTAAADTEASSKSPIAIDAHGLTVATAQDSTSDTASEPTVDPVTGLPVTPAKDAAAAGQTAAATPAAADSEQALPVEAAVAMPAATKIAAPNNASAVKVRTTSLAGDKTATPDVAAPTETIPASATAKPVSAVTEQDAKAESGDRTDASAHAAAKPDTAGEAGTDAPEAKSAAAATAAPASAHAHAPAPQTTPSDPGQLGNMMLPLQQQSTQAASTQSFAAPAPQLNVAVAANNMVPMSGLAVDIALKAASGNSRFEIRLDPAELGRIDVRLDVDKHGQVTSHLTVERPATLDMLRRDAPQLQQALENAGLKTGDGGLQFSLRDQSFAGRDDNGQSGRNSQRLIISEDPTVPAQIAGMSYGRALGSSTGVDIRI